jgi:lysyl-tRNA synthetase, class II
MPRPRKRRGAWGRPVTDAMLREREAAANVARLGIEVAAGAAPARIATEIFEALWEDQLIQPTFVYDFPTEVSPLSKQRADDPDTVERFELYIGGFEVANAFSELNDPDEQRRRFEQQLAGPRQGDSRPTRWTRTTCARSSTACRRPVARASASIGW